MSNDLRTVYASAELQLGTNLLERGFTVSYPFLDKGYDLISDLEGKMRRVQVKRLSKVLYRGISQYRQRNILGECDVLAVYGVDDKKWWFFTRKEIAKNGTLYIKDGQHIENINNYSKFL